MRAAVQGWVRGAMLVVALPLVLAGCRGAPALAGTDLGGTPAPDFAGVDQNGQTVQMQGLRGRPVVLTFLYTQCPDVCPLTASKLRRVADGLGADAGRVAFVAVSVDPAHDDAAAARTFAEQHALSDRLQFLVGAQTDLAPIWSAYAVHAAPAPVSADPAERATAAYATRAAVHTDALYVIDRQGRERTFLRSDFDPPALTSTLRTLLAE